MLSQQVVLPGEDNEAFDEVKAEFIVALQPEGPVEDMLVDTIVSTYWRMSRLIMLETCHIQDKLGLTDRTYCLKAYADAAWSAFAFNNTMVNLNRYESALDRKFYRALHELQRIQMARKGKKPPPPLAIDMDVSQ